MSEIVAPPAVSPQIFKMFLPKTFPNVLSTLTFYFLPLVYFFMADWQRVLILTEKGTT